MVLYMTKQVNELVYDLFAVSISSGNDGHQCRRAILLI